MVEQEENQGEKLEQEVGRYFPEPKENPFKSTRTWFAIATIIGVVVSILLPTFVPQITTEQSQTLAGAVGGLGATLILGRTWRNTSR